MNEKEEQIIFNGISYTILSRTIFDNVNYFLISNDDKFKIVYQIDDEIFQMINNENYKLIVDQLYSNIDEA